MLNYLPIVLSFAISVILIPLIIKFCNKHNIYDYVDSRKIHTGNISRMGGLGIFVAFIISSVLFLFMNDQLSVSKTLPVLIAGTLIFAGGLLDDLLTLKAVIKLVIQLVASAIVTVFGFRFTQIFGWVLPSALSYLLTFGWILGLVNAYNLIDGMDGLCGILVFTASVTLGVLYVFSNNYESGLCFILAASVLGFLCFNRPNAKIFMGDEGSQFLGFMIAIIPLYTSNDKFEYNKFIIMIILTALPVFDTIAAIWRRIRDHKPIMAPDGKHLHHKLLHMGYTKFTALRLVFFIQLFLCTSVIASFFVEKLASVIILSGTVIAAVGFFAIIHYSNVAVDKREENSQQ